MIKRKTLKAEKRKILGRKVKNLRNEGILPANIYGKNIASIAIQLDMLGFAKLFTEIGETEVIDLQIGETKKMHPVLIRNIQACPVTEEHLHVDFMQVDLTKKIQASVPIEFINEAPAVKEGKGILLELTNELEIESMVSDLPSKIEVDVSILKEVNDVIVAADLKLPKSVTAKVEKSQPICKIEAQKAEELSEQPEDTAAVVPSEQPEAVGAMEQEKSAITEGAEESETPRKIPPTAGSRGKQKEEKGKK